MQPLKAALATLKHMIPAVGVAILAGAVSFTALYVSPVPMIQDFGKMLKLGVIISFLVSILLLVPLLFVRDKLFASEKEYKMGQRQQVTGIDIFLSALVKRVLTMGVIIIFLAITLTGLGLWGDSRVGVQTDVEKFMPQGTQELKDIHLLREVLGTTDQLVVMYRGQDLLTEENLVWIEQVTEEIKTKYPEVVSTKSITSVLKKTNNDELPNVRDTEDILGDLPQDQIKMLLTEDRSMGAILVGVEHMEAQKMKFFIDDLNSFVLDNGQEGLEITVTGKSVLDVEMITALTTGRYQMTLLGIGLVFLVLLVVYRHPIKALIAILPISFIIGWSGGIMYLLGLEYTPLTATLGALVIGIGTEFTILIMERFYEERKKGVQTEEAIVVAIRKIGKAILASGLTVIGGFSALIISDFIILRDFGLMTVINMSLSLISTLVVLPPILVLLDRFVKTKSVTVETKELCQ